MSEYKATMQSDTDIWCPFPVGTYIENNGTFNPNTYYPNTTWTKIEGVFALASSSDYTLGTTGGSADAVLVSHTHSLTNNVGGTESRLVASGASFYTVAGSIQGMGISTEGVSGTGKNMPPYIVVNRWLRTA